MLVALLIITVLVILYIIGFFNRLKTLQVRIKASIQEIGNQFKRQAHLIPQIKETVKDFAKQEMAIFDKITDARKNMSDAVTKGDIGKMEKAQDDILRSISTIRALAESNPQIQSSTLFIKQADELRDTYDKIMYSYRTLIDLTADYNTAIQTIPGVWLAPAFGFKEEKGLDVANSEGLLQVTKDELEYK